MGLLSKLGGAIKEGARNGAVNGILKATGNNAASGQSQYAAYEYDANGNIKGVNKAYREQIAQQYGSVVDDVFYGKIGGLSSSGMTHARPSQVDTSKGSRIEKYPSKYKEAPKGLKQNTASKIIEDYNKDEKKKLSIRKDYHSDIYKLKLPDWSYADFINERAVWQKGLSSVLDEPAWFYFKIFFDFDTNHGLFGGLLNDTYLHSATNSAAKYLYSIRELHKTEKPKDRITALYKFASILSYINTNAPWYFKSVRQLNKTLVPRMDEFSKENTIEIELLPDAVDMRLSTLMSLYSYACYDTFLDKEVIPANLRKFNMSIILFQSPLRYLHTSFTTHKNMEFMGINTDMFNFGNILGGNKNNKVYYKNMSPNNGHTGNFADTMSMKIISLYGCEFDIDSLGNMVPSDIGNDTPFQLGKNSITIKYMSSYEHTMNEFYGMMFGSDGFYFNQYSNFQTDSFNGEFNSLANDWQNKQIHRYETLQSTFDNLTQGGTILGIIDSPKSYKEAIDATESIMNGIGESKNMLTSLGVNFALGLLGSSKNTNAPQGNIYGDYGIDSAYYKDKLEMLKNGVHERTTPPYYYDPYTGVKMDLHKSRNYTAYNFKNDISAIKNFDLGNWVNDKATDFGNKLNNNIRDFVYGKSDFVQNPYIDSETGQLNNRNNKSSKPGFTEVGEPGKTQLMVDNPNDWHKVEKPYTYDPERAVEIESNKEIQKGAKFLNDHPQIWNRTEVPFKYNAKNTISYERSKQADLNNSNQTDIRYDENGNPYHLFGAEEKGQFVQNPYMYNGYNKLNADIIDTHKFNGIGKDRDMVDDPNSWNRVERPFNYDPKNAVNYENSKAGDFYKVQEMVDGIGNEKHEYTEPPFNYDSKKATEYESKKRST